jgi:hypothetical protein
VKSELAIADLRLAKNLKRKKLETKETGNQLPKASPSGDRRGKEPETRKTILHFYP